MGAPDAGWYRQDDGQERYWDGAEWTDEPRPAESVASAEDPPDSAPPSEPAKSSSGVGCLAWVLLPVALILVFAFNGCDEETGSDGPDKYDVQVTCQGIVKNQLKNPGTAEFSEKQQTAVSASGSVTSENSLGGKVTYTYRCSAAAGTVKLESLTAR